MAQKSVPIAPLRHVRTQSDRPFGLSVNRNKVTARNVRKTLIACPHNRFTTQHATPGLRHKTQHKSRLPVRSTLAWITDKEFTGCPQSFSLFKFPLYYLTHTVSVWPCSPILRSLDLLHLLPLSYPQTRPQEYMRITSQVPTKDQPTPHSHKLHIDTVCLCRNVLDPCHGFTFSFTLPMS